MAAVRGWVRAKNTGAMLALGCLVKSHAGTARLQDWLRSSQASWQSRTAGTARCCRRCCCHMLPFVSNPAPAAPHLCCPAGQDPPFACCARSAAASGAACSSGGRWQFGRRGREHGRWRGGGRGAACQTGAGAGRAIAKQPNTCKHPPTMLHCWLAEMLTGAYAYLLLCALRCAVGESLTPLGVVQCELALLRVQIRADAGCGGWRRPFCRRMLRVRPAEAGLTSPGPRGHQIAVAGTAGW